jgi:CHASE3 domain sensor protein
MGQQSFKPSLTRATLLRIVAMTMFASILLFEGAEFQRTTLHSVDHASQVIGADRELVKLTIDMESGLRGFLFTGKPIFLEPYNEAADVIDARFVALNKLISDNPAHSGDLQPVETTSEGDDSTARRQLGAGFGGSPVQPDAGKQGIHGYPAREI